ncbi:MAG: NTP transferase domain-containing protein [Anaerolineae bacterium]
MSDQGAAGKELLLIGYGNTSRRDDGVAAYILEGLLSRLGRQVGEPGGEDGIDLAPGIRALFLHQLSPELAELAAAYETVVFIDAHVEGSGWEPLSWQPVAAVMEAGMVGHHLKPGVVIALAERLYGHRPNAFLLSVLGHDFAFGESLSPDTARLAEQAIDRLTEMVAAMGAGALDGRQMTRACASGGRAVLPGCGPMDPTEFPPLSEQVRTRGEMGEGSRMPADGGADTPVCEPDLPGRNTTDSEARYSVVILAGGLGMRLGGQDKATVLLEGETLLSRVKVRLATLTDDVVIVLRADQRLDSSLAEAVEGTTVTRDLQGYTGVLAGMTAGLESARHEWSLIVACDMPFVHPALIGYMWSLHEGWDVVVPRLAVGLEPLHAFYHKRCLVALHSALADGRRRVTGFYDLLRVRYVDESDIGRYDPERLSFLNINTNEDLARARGVLSKHFPS